jgi:WD40 repeat protein
MWFGNVGAAIETIAFSPDSRALYTGIYPSAAGNRVDVWDVTARTSRTVVPTGAPEARAWFTPSPDGHHLVGITFRTTQEALLVRDAATGDLISRTELPAHSHAIRLAPDVRSVWGFDYYPDGGWWRWDRFAQAPPERVAVPWPGDLRSADLWHTAIHPDGRTFAVGERGPTIVVFDTTTGEELARLQGTPKIPLPTEKVFTFNPAGDRLVVFGGGGILTAFEWPSGRLMWIKKPGGQVGHVRELVFHPTRPIVAYPTPKPPKAWPSVAWFADVNTGDSIPVPHPGFKSAGCLAFSPDSLTCAVGGSNKQFAVFDVDL